MEEKEKIASLTDAQRQFLGEVESQLKIYEALRWLKAVPTLAPVDDAIVWAREIADGRVTLALTATKESLDSKAILIRAVGNGGVRDETVGLHGLAATLETMVGYSSTNASVRRPGPVHRSGPRRGRGRRRR